DTIRRKAHMIENALFTDQSMKQNVNTSLTAEQVQLVSGACKELATTLNDEATANVKQITANGEIKNEIRKEHVTPNTLEIAKWNYQKAMNEIEKKEETLENVNRNINNITTYTDQEDYNSFEQKRLAGLKKHYKAKQKEE